MGVFCEINFNKTPNDVYISGKTVSGIIKYAINEETVFSKITISLKGRGTLKLKHPEEKAIREVKEDYINFHEVKERNKELKPIGSYQIPFNFVLPKCIPQTVEYFKETLDYKVKCKITYFIKIKFERPGLFKFSKSFKREIIVVSGISPRLPIIPIVWGEQKSFYDIFSCSNRYVNIKATIESCVVKCNEKIKLHYEVTNHTNFVIKCVVTKLIEKYTFTVETGRKIEIIDKIKNTDTKTGSIQRGEVQNMDVEIDNSNASSIDYSKLISRDYIVRITVHLPLPYRNCILNIPIQVDNDVGDGDINIDKPPSYWETMGEDTGDELDDEKKSISDLVFFQKSV